MGGCRCTFRQCSSTSSSTPGTHFFHFPHKDPVRCQKWAQYSGNLDFMNLGHSKLRNKVVCESHFRDECFMNYKKERLVQKAVPTLVRQLDGTVLDYEKCQSPFPEYLTPTMSKHLVPPDRRLSNDSSIIYADTFIVENLDDTDPLDASPTSPPILKKMKLLPPRILNVSAPQNNIVQVPKLEMSTDRISAKIYCGFDDNDAIIDTDVEFEAIVTDEDTIPEPEPDIQEMPPEVVLKSVYFEKEVEYAQGIEALKQHLAERDAEIAEKDLRIVEKDLQIAEQESEISEKDSLLAEKEAQIAAKAAVAVTQVETITTSRKTEAANTQTPLTKAQLFNGIKKYLSPSMASIVRMEMFGSSEREWKPDEKTVSVELLQLGGQVFDFIRDEWRCRLPPKREVQQWLNESNQVEDEDDL